MTIGDPIWLFVAFVVTATIEEEEGDRAHRPAI
jgi:hypothetical protein